MKLKTIACMLLAAFAVTGCVGEEPFRKDGGMVFGTYYSVTYRSRDDLSGGMKRAMDAIGATFSTFDSASLISRVNRNEEVVLNDDFTKLFAKASEVYEATGGAFDITVAPLVNAWGFGYDPARGRTAEQIDSIKAFVGGGKVRISGGQIVKDDPRLLLDASAIAKGYACDKVAAYLDSCGVKDYMIDIGGELVMKGLSPRNQKWRVGISRPAAGADPTDTERVIELSDRAVATSGNYRQFYIDGDGSRVAHTIDPRTGYPAVSPLLSATVVAADCMTADAYATAFMVLGDTAQIKAVAAGCPDDIEWYAIVKAADGSHVEACSEGFRKFER